MSLTIVCQDITKMKVDAIVNATNTDLKMGGGVSGAIFKAAGATPLQAVCDKLAPIKVGEAVITPGFGLLAKYIIHTAGPVYQPENKEQSETDLRSTYTNALKRSIENHCETIAFPLISSGIYGYHKAEALQVATSEIKAFLADHDLDVTLVVFDKSAFTVSRELLGSVESYIDEHYVVLHESRRRPLFEVERDTLSELDEAISEHYEPVSKVRLFPTQEAPSPLYYLVGNLDESFSQLLFRLIDAKGMSDVVVYKRANLDRRLFSKIRSNKSYMPSKRTALALVIALELTLSETEDLLERAGYALSHAVKFDVIIEYFIINGKYDIFEINEVLFEYDQPLLGG